MKPVISVIVPVYNTEKYLPECLDSILNQSFNNFEIIVINDCTPDNSAAIINEYASRDNRVVPIHLHKNVGQGFARNEGIDHALGKYLVMVDSDDYLNPHALKKWFDAIEAYKSDAVFGWFEIQEDKVDGTYNKTPGFYEETFKKDIPQTNFGKNHLKQIPNCWQGIYNLNFLRNYEIRFELSHREDNPFVINVLLMTEKISLISDTVSTYRKRFTENPQNISTMQKEFNRSEAFLMLEHVNIVANYFFRNNNKFPAQTIQDKMVDRFIIYSRLFFNKVLPELKKNEGLSTTRDCLHAFGDILKKTFGNDYFWHHIQFSKYHYKQADLFLFILLLMKNRCDDALSLLYYSRLPLHKGISLLENTPKSPLKKEVSNILFRYQPGTVKITGKTFPPLTLHIGLTKTGTTYLQNLMFQNRSLLLKQGILFPETGVFREPGDSSRMSGHNDFKAKSTIPGHKSLQQKLHEEIESYGHQVQRLFLSCENFAHDGTDFPVHSFRKFWEKTKVKIILCVRRQDEWLRSMYVEAVTGGWSRFSGSVEDYLAEHEIKNTLDYHILANHWAKAFGDENIEIIFLERAATKEGGLWAEFCSASGIDDYRSFAQPDKNSFNESILSSEQIEAIRLINKLPYKNTEMYFGFMRMLRSNSFFDNKESKFGLSDKMKSELISRYRESNIQLAEKFIGKSTDPFPPFTPTSIEPCTKVSVNGLDLIFDLYSKLMKQNTSFSSESIKPHPDVPKLQTQLHTVYSSRSWKITAPLRNCFKAIRKAKGALCR